MSHVELYWLRHLWHAEVEPHVLDAPCRYGATPAAAVADLYRKDPTARGLSVEMLPKNLLLRLTPFMARQREEISKCRGPR